MSVPNKAARNERRKLLATWLNTLAGATVTVGVLAPMAGMFYGMGVPPRDWREIALALFVWLSVGCVLHLVARSLLGGIGMTTAEIYAHYVAPLVMLGVGLGVVGVTRLLERRERRQAKAAGPLR